MEHFIREKYGEHVFFISAMSAVFQIPEEEQLVSIRNFIKRERINSIHIVNDLSCTFISNAITKQKKLEPQIECYIENLFIQNYSIISELPTLEQQKVKLAELNIQYQALQLLKPHILGTQIIQNNIQIKGLMTKKIENKYIDIEINTQK